MKRIGMARRLAALACAALFVFVGAGAVGCKQSAAAGGQATASSGSGSSTSSSSSSSSSASKVSWSGSQTVTVVDPMNGMTALTAQIPAGWLFAGTVTRPTGCHAPPIAWMSTSAVAQDGITALVSLPSVSWNWTSSKAMEKFNVAHKCPSVDISTAAGFLVNIALPNLQPNAKVEAVLGPNASDQASIAAQKLAPGRTLDGAQLRIQYVQAGLPIEEMISATVDCTTTTGVALFGSGEGPPQNRRCSTNGTNIVRAPQGQLDAALAAIASPSFQALAKNSHPNNDWFMRVVKEQQSVFAQATAQFNQSAAAIRAQGQAEQNARIAKAQQFDAQLKASTQASMANAQASQNAVDAAAHASENYSLDRQDFVNTATGQTITASSQYNHAWMSSDQSTLIQTNDPTLDPNGSVYPVSQSWNELVPK